MNKVRTQYSALYTLPKLFFLASSTFSQVFAVPLLDVVISKHEKVPIGSDGKSYKHLIQSKRSSPH